MATSTSYQVAPPEKFDFKNQEEWPKWSRRFERFHSASILKEKDDETQVHTSVYCMGDEADDLLSSFGHSSADSKKYSKVMEKFESFLSNTKT